ncbi:hypothetical protein LINPERPRIM_LOCUS40413 [Linum perenne]
MNRIIVETDCQAVQLALEGTDEAMTEFGTIIGRGRGLLVDQPHKKVAFVRRGGNTVAHALARRSIISSDLVIGSEVPNWLCNTLRDVCILRH